MQHLVSGWQSSQQLRSRSCSTLKDLNRLTNKLDAGQRWRSTANVYWSTSGSSHWPQQSCELLTGHSTRGWDAQRQRLQWQNTISEYKNVTKTWIIYRDARHITIGMLREETAVWRRTLYKNMSEKEEPLEDKEEDGLKILLNGLGYRLMSMHKLLKTPLILCLQPTVLNDSTRWRKTTSKIKYSKNWIAQ